MGTHCGVESPDHGALWQLVLDAGADAGPGGVVDRAPRDPASVAARAFLLSALVDPGRRGERPDLSRATLQVALDGMRRDFLERVAKAPVEPRLECVLGVLRSFDDLHDALDLSEARSNGRFPDAAGFEMPAPPALVVELAHDMRSPLTSILFLVDALRQQQRRTQLSAVATRQLAIVYSAAFSLSSLVSDVVDLAKRGSRLLEREPIPLSIADMMRSVQEMVQPIAEEKNLALHFNQCCRDVRLGQPLALCRVLLNLTTNALKFTAHGSVTIKAHEEGVSRVRFEVLDTGRGIPPETVDTILDRRLIRDTGGARRPGLSHTRLGLAMCDSLVQAMGSRLHVRSVVGEGTCFSFELDMPVAPTPRASAKTGMRLS